MAPKAIFMTLRAAFGRLRTEPVACSCGYRNAPKNSIKDGKFLDHLSDYQLLKTRVS
jgi:hypothetical protein